MMGAYFNEIVQRKPMLASQETVPPAKKEAKIDALNSVRCNSKVHTLQHQSLDQVSQTKLDHRNELTWLTVLATAASPCSIAVLSREIDHYSPSIEDPRGAMSAAPDGDK
jgi:hypothetical protein